MGIILQFARPSDVRGGTATTANLCQRFDATLVANRFELKRRCNKEVIMASASGTGSGRQRAGQLNND